MNQRSKILIASISIMAAVALAVGAVSITVLFQAALKRQRTLLLEMAKSEAEHIAAIARYGSAATEDAMDYATAKNELRCARNASETETTT